MTKRSIHLDCYYALKEGKRKRMSKNFLPGRLFTATPCLPSSLRCKGGNGCVNSSAALTVREGEDGMDAKIQP